MVVKRISDIDIHRRNFITAIKGNIDDSFIDNDLCCYSFEQQLYLYLKNEDYDNVFFYNRKDNLYSYDKESLKSISYDDEDIQQGTKAGHPYYYTTPKDSSLINTIDDILKNNEKKSVIYFTTSLLLIEKESQRFVDLIASAKNESSVSKSDNKILFNYNSEGIFKANYFVDQLNNPTNVFTVGLPDKKECENWINHIRIMGMINSINVFNYPLDSLVDQIYRQQKKIDYLNTELKLKKDLFFKSVVDYKTDDEVLSELNKMVGLRSIKEALAGIIANVKIQQLRKQYGQTKESKVGLNFVFKGNPGTGKTTVAGLLGNILAHYGLIDNPEVVRYSKGQLIDGSVGGGSRGVEKMFYDSVGKVLFIDEAYQLAEEDAKDALDALTNMMTDIRFENKLAIILAGYPGDMARLIQGNPGLRSRFTQNIFFEDYTNEELTEIFRIKLIDENFIVGEDELVYANSFFKNIKRKIGFGNARVCKDLLDTVKSNQAQRVLKIELPTKDDVFTIISQDFPNYGKDILEKYKAQHELNLTPEEKLEKLIGIDDIRKQFKVYVKMSHYCRDNPHSSISSKFRPHMVFLGNQGTGKTTVAQLFAKILLKEGLLINNNFVEIGPADLIGQYLGSSGQKARDQFERARGGVLFIDEAYQLYRKSQANGGNQYGQEVLTELIRFMEDDRDTIVILAGYTEETRYMIENGNSGLSSRVTNEFIFKDYEPNVLYQILLNCLCDFEMSDSFKKKILQIINHEYKKNKHSSWGNARTIETFSEKIFRNYLINHDAKGIIDIDSIPNEFLLNLPQEN